MGATRTYAREADRARRREEGEQRNEAWRKLTPAEQLASLDRRLGKGVGAKRQRRKLS